MRPHGFTLIELLVVLAIGALMLGLMPLAYDRLRESAQYRDVVRTIYSEVKAARSQATLTGEPTRFVVHAQRREYGVPGRVVHPIPDAIQVRATVAASESGRTGDAGIVFAPQGGSTGGIVEIVRRSGAGTRIRVDWLTGRVSQEAMVP